MYVSRFSTKISFLMCLKCMTIFLIERITNYLEIITDLIEDEQNGFR